MKEFPWNEELLTFTYWKNKILKEKVSWQEIKNNLISLLEEVGALDA